MNTITKQVCIALKFYSRDAQFKSSYNPIYLRGFHSLPQSLQANVRIVPQWDQVTSLQILSSLLAEIIIALYWLHTDSIITFPPPPPLTLSLFF
jgi:hypothetical protein